MLNAWIDIWIVLFALIVCESLRWLWSLTMIRVRQDSRSIKWLLLPRSSKPAQISLIVWIVWTYFEAISTIKTILTIILVIWKPLAFKKLRLPFTGYFALGLKELPTTTAMVTDSSKKASGLERKNNSTVRESRFFLNHFVSLSYWHNYDVNWLNFEFS